MWRSVLCSSLCFVAEAKLLEATEQTDSARPFLGQCTADVHRGCELVGLLTCLDPPPFKLRRALRNKPGQVQPFVLWILKFLGDPGAPGP